MTPIYKSKGQTFAGGNFDTAQLCFSGTLMSNRQSVYYDFQAESSGWLYKSPLAGGGGILRRPHYRLHSLLCPTQGALSDDAV